MPFAASDLAVLCAVGAKALGAWRLVSRCEHVPLLLLSFLLGDSQMEHFCSAQWPAVPSVAAYMHVLSPAANGAVLCSWRQGARGLVMHSNIYAMAIVEAECASSPR
jgi:hypothetical protein